MKGLSSSSPASSPSSPSSSWVAAEGKSVDWVFVGLHYLFLLLHFVFFGKKKVSNEKNHSKKIMMIYLHTFCMFRFLCTLGYYPFFVPFSLHLFWFFFSGFSNVNPVTIWFTNLMFSILKLDEEQDQAKDNIGVEMGREWRLYQVLTILKVESFWTWIYISSCGFFGHTKNLASVRLHFLIIELRIIMRKTIDWITTKIGSSSF